MAVEEVPLGGFIPVPSPEAGASWTEAWDEGSVLHELWEDGAA
ncbi:hypothetical protein [Streptomyces mirabilis]